MEHSSEAGFWRYHKEGNINVTATASNFTVTNVTNAKAVNITNAREDITSNATAKTMKTSAKSLNGSAGFQPALPSASAPLLRVPDPTIGGSSCQDGCAGTIL